MPVLQFKGKTAIETYHHTIPHHALEFDEKISVLGKGEKPSLDGNLIIEGDNLLALKALLPTHAGKIKCIYIDPPYNTGDEGWVYNDNLSQPQFKEWIGQVVGKEEEDACRHDKWCCMMFPRLQLLKELLREDGIIFVSIDDNEVSNLNFLLDEIFGSDNRIERLIWKKSYGGGAKERHIVTMHEYILCYAKNINAIDNLELNPDPRVVERYYKYTDSKFPSRGPYRLKPLEATKSMGERKNLVYGIPLPDGGEVWPERQWWWKKERTMKALHDDELVFIKTKKGISVNYKQYLKDEEGEERGAKLFSVIDGIFTQEGTNDLKDIFDGKLVFPFPKPVRLIEKLMELVTQNNDIVLDSFAGSGTTGQAILELNREDNGNRVFILVQQPFDTRSQEKQGTNICREITRERIRRVIQGYTFTGSKDKTLLEEKVSVAMLKKASVLIERIDGLRESKAKMFDGVKVECDEGVVRVVGKLDIRKSVEGLGGSFVYNKLSTHPIFGEYRDITKHPPSYEEIAKYIFYTETSTVWDKKGLNGKTGKIGEHRNTSLYLLYTPNQKDDQALDVTFLNSIMAKDKNPVIVIYCEKIWVHRSELLDWSAKHKKNVRTMIVPFNLK